MPTSRCPRCVIRWPAREEFRLCPACGTKTADQAYSDPELERSFELFYRLRDEERERRGEPSPDALGRMQARREIAELRALEAKLEATPSV